MDRPTLHDLFSQRLPVLFGCHGYLPLADCAAAPPPPIEPAASVATAAASTAPETTMGAPLELNATKTPHPPHPYYPPDVDIVGYLANDLTVPQLLGAFAVGCAVLFLTTYLIAKRIRPKLPASELLTILWFVLSGCIHVFFEGFYVYNFQKLAASQHLFGQLWKEYALSDSRYLTQDPLVLCMETITAICWGPLSFVVAHLITTEHHLRYPLQAVVSLGHVYGDMLYYATSLLNHYMMNLSYSRPEACYWWGYFIFMNAFWIVIPLVLIISSVRASGRAFKALARCERCLRANGIGEAKKSM